jgi:hypothetical protein
VSTDIPAAHRFAALIHVTRTPDEFVQALEAALQTPGDPAARQRAAAGHSWQARFELVQQLVEPVRAAKLVK